MNDLIVLQGAGADGNVVWKAIFFTRTVTIASLS